MMPMSALASLLRSVLSGEASNLFDIAALGEFSVVLAYVLKCVIYAWSLRETDRFGILVLLN